MKMVSETLTLKKQVHYVSNETKCFLLGGYCVDTILQFINTIFFLGAILCLP